MLATDEATRDAPISQIKELLIVEGYDFESGPTRLDDRLMAACNSVQKKRLEKAWATRKEPLRLERMYKVPESLEQAHLLFSHDRQRILHSFKWILDALPDDAETIADVGCGTGSLSRLIAHYFPRASVLGVDIAKN
ncbi:MAG: hypothetical protein R3302_07910, partial [Sulfurimonadaceae bacterium]|nr:hypothetical protein [Sulfurimonadaceae bacterium]